jgi:predicted acylesterase/phospholipase RssA
MADIDVVISGGSINGILNSIGFIKALTVDLGHTIISGAGASAGGIILSAYASGRSVEDIENIIINTDISRLIKIPRPWQLIKIWNAYHKGWVCDGVALENFMGCMTGYKAFGNATIDLHIAASDFTNSTLVDLCKEYDPSMPLYKAMRITSCVPGLFKPVAYNNIVWQDGSISSYFPIELLPPSPRQVFGFVSQALNPQTVSDKLNTYGVLAGLIDHSVEFNIKNSIRLSGRKPTLVSYKDPKVSTYDFGISPIEKKNLIEAARVATLKKLS